MRNIFRRTSLFVLIAVSSQTVANASTQVAEVAALRSDQFGIEQISELVRDGVQGMRKPLITVADGVQGMRKPLVA